MPVHPRNTTGTTPSGTLASRGHNGLRSAFTSASTYLDPCILRATRKTSLRNRACVRYDGQAAIGEKLTWQSSYARSAAIRFQTGRQAARAAGHRLQGPLQRGCRAGKL